MANATITPPNFWTDFSPELRTELRNHLDPNRLGAAIEDSDSEETRREISSLEQNLLQNGKWQLAEELLTYYYLARTAALGGKANRDTLSTLFSVAYAQMAQENFVKAEKTWRDLLALSLDEQDSRLRTNLGAESNLGFTLNKLGKYEEAEQVLRALLPRMQKQFDESDPRVLGCMRHLMEALIGLGQLSKASDMNKEGMRLTARVSEVHREAEVEAMHEMHQKILDAEIDNA